MEQIVFPVPNICEYLTRESKSRVFTMTERDEQGSKVNDFFQQTEDLYNEMKWQKKIRSKYSKRAWWVWGVAVDPLVLWDTWHSSVKLVFNFLPSDVTEIPYSLKNISSIYILGWSQDSCSFMHTETSDLAHLPVLILWFYKYYEI